MLKTLVTFESLTGNTKKIAEAIFEAVEGEKALIPLAEGPSLDEFSLVFIGFPVHSHSVPYKVETFLKNIPAGKKVAFFCTHGTLTGSRLSREALEYAVTLTTKARVLGTFTCRGKVSLEALEVLSKSPEHSAWTDMAASARSHPDESDLKDAQAFAQWILTLYAQP
ncbi:flavodoxin family protein [Acidobacteriota bacterium]